MRKLQVCNLCSAVQDATHKQKKTFVEGGTILIVEGLFKRNPLLNQDPQSDILAGNILAARK